MRCWRDGRSAACFGWTATLVDGLHFANGVTATADGSAVVFAETSARRLSKYWLSGPRAGQVTPLVENLPGHPTTFRRDPTGGSGRPRWPLRKLLWRLPDRFAPPVPAEVWAVGFDPDTGGAVGGLRTTHPDFGQVTGLVESRGRLWMGCIGAAAVAYTEL